jgi:hypothetical protein
LRVVAHHGSDLLPRLEQAVWVGIDPAGGLDARHAGKGCAFGQAETGMQLGSVQPNASTLIRTSRGLARGRQVAQVQVRDWPGVVSGGRDGSGSVFPAWHGRGKIRMAGQGGAELLRTMQVPLHQAREPRLVR